MYVQDGLWEGSDAHERVWRAGESYGRQVGAEKALHSALMALIEAGQHDSEAFPVVEAIYRDVACRPFTE